MTIQQGTTPYVYPQSDAAMPVVLDNMTSVRNAYGARGYVRSQDVVNPFKASSPYILQGITVLEHLDRYTGHLPYFPEGKSIASEAYPAAREGMLVAQQHAAKIALTIRQNEHRDQFCLAYLLSVYGLGQAPITVTKVTPQSIVEHYLFNGKPRAYAVDQTTRFDPNYIGLNPIPDEGLAYFRNLLTTYDINDWDLDYYYSTQQDLETRLYDDWPAIPKLEHDRIVGSYDIEALIQFYHGYFSSVLSGIERTLYLKRNWFARIQTLVRSAVLCQYFWSVRMLLNYPSIIIEVPMQLESGDPMLWEDGRKLMTEGYRTWG